MNTFLHDCNHVKIEGREIIIQIIKIVDITQAIKMLIREHGGHVFGTTGSRK